MNIFRIFILMILVLSLSGGHAIAKKGKGIGGMMHGGMMGEGMMGGMKEHREEHHKLMNDAMQAIADLAAVVKDSVDDAAAKDKCDAIIAEVGELIKKHDEMMKAHEEKMEEMMKSHQEMMEKKKKKKGKK